MSEFEIAVIGGGLIGSAAARHLAEAGRRVVAIAAPEPSDWSAGHGPFSSHYDAGRITRLMARDEVWAELAARSVGRYRDIEQRSGIDFHRPSGLVWAVPDVSEAVGHAVGRGGDARVVTNDWVFATTGIRVPPTHQVAIEGPPAGAIDPQRLVAAQLRLAELAGARLIGGAVDSMSRTSPSGRSRFALSGDFGEVTADRVLLATGAYGAELVGVDLGLERLLRTTVRIDMGEAPDLPSLIIDPVEHPLVADVYWVPPVVYPDGRRLFKIGCEMLAARRAESPSDIDAWFATDGDSAEAMALVDTTRALLPTRKLHSWHAVPCVVTRTGSGHPIVGWIDDDVAVALGGNGSAAKSSDELGRLASLLFNPAGWTDPSLTPDLFTPQPGAGV